MPVLPSQAGLCQTTTESTGRFPGGSPSCDKFSCFSFLTLTCHLQLEYLVRGQREDDEGFLLADSLGVLVNGRMCAPKARGGPRPAGPPRTRSPREGGRLVKPPSAYLVVVGHPV